MHRDVKAANLLIDDDGTVLLGDLGVAAFLWDTEDTPPPPAFPVTQKRTVNFSSTSTSNAALPRNTRNLGKRKSFVGTPCWMAPEVINGKQYDSSADIWSFGITALELAQGRAPRSREATHKALLQTVQEAPPQLDRNGGPHRYSRAFQDIIARCLDKDPAARPSAEELLQTLFFRGAKRKSFLVNTLLRELPPLTQRQERRKLPSIIGQRTMDSWDFSSVATSPTTSVYSRHKRSELGTLPSDGVFEIDDTNDGEVGDDDDDDDGGSEGGSSNEDKSDGDSAKEFELKTKEQYTSAPRPPSRPHSRSISWSDRQLAAVIVEGEDDQDGADVAAQPPADRSAPIPVPVSSAQNNSHLLPIAVAASGSSSSSTSPGVSSSESTSAATPPRHSTSTRLWQKLTGRSDGDKDNNTRTQIDIDSINSRRRKIIGRVLSRPGVS